MKQRHFDLTFTVIIPRETNVKPIPNECGFYFDLNPKHFTDFFINYEFQKVRRNNILQHFPNL